MLASLLKKRETGFTLIELLTVIIIIGVLAAIAIPVFTAQKSRAQDSQTTSDVRNIVTATETYLSDRTKSVADITGQSVIEYRSSVNVLWDIRGNATTGGYCVAAFNASGKDYKTTSTLLTYDSTAGGLKKVGGSCGTVVGGATGANGSVTPTPTTSTAVGSSTATPAAAFATNLNLSRATSAATTVQVSWTAAADTNVTGYKVERSTDGTNYTTLTTTSGRTSTAYSDANAGTSTAYYKITPMMSTTASTAVLNGVAFASTSGNNPGQTGSTQTFVVPESGRYTISTFGAQGGTYSNSGGLGGTVTAVHSLTAGQTLTVVVGSQGGSGQHGAGGGGGSFVYANTTSPLQVSGGGGGAQPYEGRPGLPAVTTAGSGQGGSAVAAGGGAGWLADGSNGGGPGGKTKNTWTGGNDGSTTCGVGYAGYGGFGGGGGGYCAGGGGGGGYTGGTGNGYSNHNSYTGGGGGSNFIASTATNVSNDVTNTGNGKVFITELEN